MSSESVNDEANDEPNDAPSTLDWLEAISVARQFADGGQPRRAIGELQQIADQVDDNVAVLVELTDVFGHLGRFDEAEAALHRAVEIDARSPAVAAARGILLFRRGLYEQAEVQLREVCRTEPEHGLAHYYRGEALNRIGRVDEAIEVLQNATRVDPADARAYHSLGRLYDRKGQPEAAAGMYRVARSLEGSP